MQSHSGKRGVAQLASASGLGPEGPVFESQYPDKKETLKNVSFFVGVRGAEHPILLCLGALPLLYPAAPPSVFAFGKYTAPAVALVREYVVGFRVVMVWGFFLTIDYGKRCWDLIVSKRPGTYRLKAAIILAGDRRANNSLFMKSIAGATCSKNL